MSDKLTEKRFLRFFRKRKQDTVAKPGNPPALVQLVTFFAILCIGMGAWMCRQGSTPFLLTGESERYKVPGKILLFTGSMMMATGMVTVLTSGILLRVSLTSLRNCLSMAILLLVMAGSASFSLHAALGAGALNVSLVEELHLTRYRSCSRIEQALDEMQERFRCCGVEGVGDWQLSVWRTGSQKDFYPGSCCQAGRRSVCTEADVANATGCGKLATGSLMSMLESCLTCSFICVWVCLTSFLILCFLEKRV